MGRLDDLALADLQGQLDETQGEVPTQRVLAAIGRKQGDDIATLAERHDVVEKTIRNWLDRFAEQPLAEAPYDEQRPGGPSKLTDEQHEQLAEDFRTPPTELGYDRQAWTASLAVHHIASEFGVEYTRRHARELLAQTDLSWRTARPRHHAADPEKEAEFQETVQKKDRS